MKIRIDRINFTETYTEGELRIDGEFFCNTIEDKDWGLHKKSVVDYNREHEQIYNLKKENMSGRSGSYGQRAITAIPRGDYLVGFRMSPGFGFMTPWVFGVPGFTQILFHNGTNAGHSGGCIILGKKNGEGRVNPRNASGLYYSHIFRDILWDACGVYRTNEISKLPLIKTGKEDDIHPEDYYNYMPINTLIELQIEGKKEIFENHLYNPKYSPKYNTREMKIIDKTHYK